MTAGETVYVLMSATDISSWNQTYSLMFSLAEPLGDSMVEDMVYLFNGHTLVGALRLVIDFLGSQIEGIQFKNKLNQSK